MAAEAGLPVAMGARVIGVIKGSAAEAAHLQIGDVISADRRQRRRGRLPPDLPHQLPEGRPADAAVGLPRRQDADDFGDDGRSRRVRPERVDGLPALIATFAKCRPRWPGSIAALCHRDLRLTSAPSLRTLYYRSIQGVSMSTAVSIRLPEELAKARWQIAAETERPRSFHIQKALESYIEDFADVQIALDRLCNPKDAIVAGRELRKSLGL